MDMIKSRTNSHILKAISYKDIKNIEKDKIFLNEGIINLKEGLKWGDVVEIYVTEKHINTFSNTNIPTYLISEDVSKKMSLLKNSNGVHFLSRIKENDISKAKKIVYLDDVQDPGNVGTIIRTALAFNFDLVVLSLKSASLYNEKVLQSARGSNYKIDVIKEDYFDLIKRFPKHQIICTSLDEDSIPLENINIKDDFIVVFGNEGRGIKEEIIKTAQKKVIIEMNEIDSLNVALSAAIILYRLK